MSRERLSSYASIGFPWRDLTPAEASFKLIRPFLPVTRRAQPATNEFALSGITASLCGINAHTHSSQKSVLGVKRTSRRHDVLRQSRSQIIGHQVLDQRPMGNCRFHAYSSCSVSRINNIKNLGGLMTIVWGRGPYNISG